MASTAPPLKATRWRRLARARGNRARRACHRRGVLARPHRHDRSVPGTGWQPHRCRSGVRRTLHRSATASPARSVRRPAMRPSRSPSCRRRRFTQASTAQLRGTRRASRPGHHLPGRATQAWGLLNAEQFRQPYGAPAIHVASEARDAVLSAANRPPRRLHKPHSVACARNVIVAIPRTRSSASRRSW